MSKEILISPQALQRLSELGYCCANCGVFYPEPAFSDGFCSESCRDKHLERRVETKKVFDELVEQYGSQQALLDAMSSAFGDVP